MPAAKGRPSTLAQLYGKKSAVTKPQALALLELWPVLRPEPRREESSALR